MKRIKRSLAICFCAVAVFSGCTDFSTATIDTITEKNFEYDTASKELTGTAMISDNGDCLYFREQGFCYRLDTFPSLNDVFSTQIMVKKDTLTDTIKATFPLPYVDTSYYVRAYVKNCAGLSYSNVVKIEIKSPESTEPEQ